jgi:peptidoglycan biosynthesis protein MviN/MurJ (putative lipid II flippase)
MLIGLPITWILLVHYGMLGAVVASVVNSVVGATISLTIVRRMYRVNIKVMNVIKYLVPSLIAGSLTYSITCMVKGLWLTLGIGSVLYLVLLVMLMVVVVSKEDLIHLASISRSMKYVGFIINYALDMAVKIKVLLCRQQP